VNDTFTCNNAINVSFLTGGNKSIYYGANDTLGHTRTNNLSFYIGVYSTVAVPYSIAEGSASLFNLTINKTGIGLETLNATLRYNNTNYPYTSLSLISNDYVIFGTEIVVPIGTGNLTGRNILWNYNFTGSTSGNYATRTQNQTVYSVEIDNCSVFSEVILNMTLRDEGTQQRVNGSLGSNIQLDLTLSSLEDESIVWEYNNTWIDQSEAVVCIPNTLLPTTNFTIDFVAEYSSTGRMVEFYYLDDGLLSQLPSFNSMTNKKINLYDLNTSDSTTFLFEFLGEDNLEVPDAIVHTFRQYIGDGVFREVERSKQDNNGETHIHLVEEDVIYYFVISLYGDVLYTSTVYNAKCLSEPCSISIEALPDVEPFPTDWDLMPNGTYIVTENGVTRNVYLYFQSLEAVLMNFTIAKQDYDGDVEIIGTTSATATSGNLSIFVPASAGNVTFYAIVHRDNEFIAYSLVDFSDTTNYYGTTGNYMGFLLVTGLVLMGATEGLLFFAFLILALIIVGALALLNFGYYALVGFICAMGLVVYKLIKRGRTIR
jgi:hypothetical protein